MTLTLNNPLIYNQAFAGALAGQLAGSGLTGIAATDQTAGTYAAQANIAGVFAEAVDAVIPQGAPGAIANVSSAHATIPPSTAADASTQSAYAAAMFGICFGYWFQRKSANIQASGDGGLTESDYAYIAATIAAQFAEASAVLVANGTLV
jgi:hypothetical protein